MSKPEWGIKRTCQSCHSVFYDMKKDPIVCPKCKTVYDTDMLLKAMNTDELDQKDESKEKLSDDFAYHSEDEVFLDNQEDFLENLEELDSEFEPSELSQGSA